MKRSCSECGYEFKNPEEKHICIICQEAYCKDCITIDVIEICEYCDTQKK